MTTGSAPVPEPIMQEIQAQLTWLIEFFEGHHTEHSKLHKLTFGYFAAREIEDSDPEFTNALYKASYVASRTAGGLKIDTTVLGTDT